MLCAIWYHLYNLKNVKNIHEGVLLLANLQDHSYWSLFFMQLQAGRPGTLLKLVSSTGESTTFLKVTLLHGCFLRFLNCTNGTKSREVFHMNII